MPLLTIVSFLVDRSHCEVKRISYRYGRLVSQCRRRSATPSSSSSRVVIVLLRRSPVNTFVFTVKSVVSNNLLETSVMSLCRSVRINQLYSLFHGFCFYATKKIFRFVWLIRKTLFFFLSWFNGLFIVVFYGKKQTAFFFLPFLTLCLFFNFYEGFLAH